MANGQALPVQFLCQTKPYKKYNFQIDGTYFTILWCMTLTIGPLTNFSLLFPVVWVFLCLAKLYRNCPIFDKGL